MDHISILRTFFLFLSASNTAMSEIKKLFGLTAQWRQGCGLAFSR
jgi:hypothetical protein